MRSIGGEFEDSRLLVSLAFQFQRFPEVHKAVIIVSLDDV